MTSPTDSPPTPVSGEQGSDRIPLWGERSRITRLLLWSSAYLSPKAILELSRLLLRCAGWWSSLVLTLAGTISRCGLSRRDRISLARRLIGNYSVAFGVPIDLSGMPGMQNNSGSRFVMQIACRLSDILGGTAMTPPSTPPVSQVPSILDPFASGLSPMESRAIHSITSSPRSV